jgi:large subunit ribosomal protein L28e
MSNSEVVWNIVKKSSSFLVKNNGLTLTSEPFNVMNLNVRKYSGLANKKALSLSVKDGKVVLVKRLAKKTRFPSKLSSSAILHKTQVNHQNRGALNIRKMTTGSFYRPDLADLAVARYNKLQKAIKASSKTAKAPPATVAMQIAKTD